MPDAPKAVQAVHKAQLDTVATSSVHDKEVELSKPPLWQAILGFLLVAGTMGYFLMHVDQYRGYLQYYIWGRNIVFLGTSLLIIIIAYHDSIGHGAVALLFPPYMLWYAWTRLESYLLKGLFYGIVAVLIAEVYYLREDAIATHVQHFASEFVTTVDGLIERAAE